MRFSLCMFPKNSLTRFLFSISISTSLFWFNSKSKRPSRVLSVRGGSGERVAVLAWTLVIIAHQTPRPSHPQELSRTISSLIMRSAWGDRVHTRHAPSDGRTDELHPSLVLLFLVSTASPPPHDPSIKRCYTGHACIAQIRSTTMPSDPPSRPFPDRGRTQTSHSFAPPWHTRSSIIAPPRSQALPEKTMCRRGRESREPHCGTQKARERAKAKPTLEREVGEVSGEVGEVSLPREKRGETKRG